LLIRQVAAPGIVRLRQTVSDCASTPFCASKTTTAPSSAQAALDLGGEIDVARSVDQVTVQSRHLNGMQRYRW